MLRCSRQARCSTRLCRDKFYSTSSLYFSAPPSLPVPNLPVRYRVSPGVLHATTWSLTPTESSPFEGDFVILRHESIGSILSKSEYGLRLFRSSSPAKCQLDWHVRSLEKKHKTKEHLSEFSLFTHGHRLDGKQPQMIRPCILGF